MLSLILPTYNEARNLPTLLLLLSRVLRAHEHEIIVVDDNSPDGTWQVGETLKSDYSQLRILRRMGKKGLSSAVVDGFDAAKGSILVVMDADGQHDADLLIRMLAAIDSNADIAIGSRYIMGGSIGHWVRDRRIISRVGTFLAHHASQQAVSDPLGGFFAIRRSLYEKIRSKLRPSGFKILLEILAHVPSSAQVVEIPLVFRSRLHGESKLSFRVHCQFLLQVVRLACVRWRSSLHLLAGVAFWVAVATCMLVLLPRVWALRRLYVFPSLRSSVEKTLRNVTDREGWLLSDVSLTSVDWQGVHFVHREHRRWNAMSSSCSVSYASQQLTCVDQ